jgi:hypothetical protein
LINSSMRSLNLKHFFVSCPLHLWYAHSEFRFPPSIWSLPLVGGNWVSSVYNISFRIYTLARFKGVYSFPWGNLSTSRLNCWW